jgi:hypothetical protein
MFKTQKQALAVVVSLSQPGKIPTFSYSISAKRCNVGSKLVNVKDSICSGCYALKGWYPKRKVIADTFEKRYQSLKDPQWSEAMAFLINAKKLAYFRWHDSGDLQGVWHLEKIVQVAILTPDTWHWLPTREWGIVNKYISAGNKIPDNLCIRLSATMFDKEAPRQLASKLGVCTSEVSSDESKVSCPAHNNTYVTQNGQKKEWKGHCGSCRNCWDKKVSNVTYLRH